MCPNLGRISLRNTDKALVDGRKQGPFFIPLKGEEHECKP